MISFIRLWNKLKFDTSNMLYTTGIKCEHSGAKALQWNVHRDGSMSGFNIKPVYL